MINLTVLLFLQLILMLFLGLLALKFSKGNVYALILVQGLVAVFFLLIIPSLTCEVI